MELVFRGVLGSYDAPGGGALPGQIWLNQWTCGMPRMAEG